MTKEVMKQALEALEAIMMVRDIDSATTIAKNARYGLREALKQEQGEPKEWVSLTNEQIVDLVIKNAGFPTKLAKAIEAKLKEKNS